MNNSNERLESSDSKQSISNMLYNHAKSWYDSIKSYLIRIYIENESTITRLNKKSKLYRLARLWVWVKFLYPLLFISMFFIFMIVAYTAWNQATGHLVLGSIISLFSSVTVIASYVMIIPWRKHPSSLIFYRALTSIIFSINIILNAVSANNQNCRSFAAVTEFMLLAGEAWLTTVAADLVASITNPFTSYKANINRYHIYVWVFCALITFIFYFDLNCHGSFDNAICWVNIYFGNGSCIWGYYLIWMILMYSYQMYASVYAYLRLKKGLPATFEIRKKCAEETFRILISYGIYMTLVAMLYIIFSATNNSVRQETVTNINFGYFVLYVIANKGSVDGLVWFYLHDFDSNRQKQLHGSSSSNNNASYNPILKISAASNREIAGSENPSPVSTPHAHRQNGDSNFASDENNDLVDLEQKSGNNIESHYGIKDGASKLFTNVKDKLHVQDIQKNFTQTITELADLAIEEVDEEDLSPQVNLALRQQVVQYVTSGVKQSVNFKANSVEQAAVRAARSDSVIVQAEAATKRYVDTRKDPAVVEGLQVTEFLLETDELPFKSFATDLFREIRLNEGISDSYYLKLLSSPTNERLSEGASGAFMFFCGNNELIVKTIRAREAKVLHQSMKQYSELFKNE